MAQNREMKMDFVDAAAQESKPKRARRKTKKQMEMEAALMEAAGEGARAAEEPKGDKKADSPEIAVSAETLLEASIDELSRAQILAESAQIILSNSEGSKTEPQESAAPAASEETPGVVFENVSAPDGEKAEEQAASAAEPEVHQASAESAERQGAEDAGVSAQAPAEEAASPEKEDNVPIRNQAAEAAPIRQCRTFGAEGEERRKIRIFGLAVNRPESLYVPEWLSQFLRTCGQKLAAPMSIILLATMIAAIVVFVRNQYISARHILDAGPEKAYALASEGNAEGAKQIWIQVNAKTFWYQPFSGFFTSIDEPYLQKASIAYKAEDWQKVAENAYKALRVPITDQQAVYVQQMILQATANMVKAYLPNQAEQPIRGGVPDHASPVCEPSATYIWVVPAILILMAGAFLYSRKRVMFAIMALLMPCYFWFVNANNTAATQTCELRLSFNPEHITLYGEPVVPLPPFTPTPLRVESVPLDKAKALPKSAPVEAPVAASIPKSEFGTVDSPLKIEQGNAPAQPKKP